MKKIIIIDDNPTDIELLSAWCKQFKNTSILKHFVTGFDAIASSITYEADVIIVDMRMPLLNGVETAILLLAKGFTGKIIGISHAYYHHDKLKLQEIGAHGYCEKTKESFFATLAKVERCGTAFDEQQFENWNHRTVNKKLHTKDEDEKMRLMNPHYKKILIHTYQGLNTTEIAHTMQLKKHTVEQYRANMLQQLGFTNICQATAWALLNNIIITSELPPPPPQIG